ncbi:MAG TPA: DUF2243 domain-containing protein [Rubricoccaceae bacterium]|nr:DUF2243 domain-containing protein [Rubricoccaceae bacterium]
MNAPRLPDADGPRRQARTAALLLGLGLGGFADGIALHQIAQWHNMLSARLPPTTMEAMRTNMTADGWFHAATWVLTLAGVLLLYRAARHGAPLPPVRWLVGLLLVGWGTFNLVEGVIDHHLLELHHVRDVPRHVPAYDYAFLLVGGLGLLALGGAFARSARGLDH